MKTIRNRSLWLLIPLLATALADRQRTYGAEERVALVIANNQYSEEVGELANAVNDGRSVARELHLLDFDVTTVEDADKGRMEEELAGFLGKLREGAIGFFYFAGHGVQIEGMNYLLPVDAVAESPYRIKYSSISVNQIFDLFVEKKTRANVVVLDCCRNNPFEQRSVARSANVRSLGDVKEPPGTLVAFSTASGTVAADVDPSGSGNSPYTVALVEELRKRPERGLELTEVFRNTSRTVFNRTRQDPLLKIPGSIGEVILVRGSAPIEPVNANPGTVGTLTVNDPQVERRLEEMVRVAAEKAAADVRRQYEEKLALQEAARKQAEEEARKKANEEAMAAALLAQNTEIVQPEPVGRAIQGPWLFPDSSDRLLTDTELSRLTDEQLWIARNEIYARNGFIFSSAKGRRYQASLGAFHQGVSSSDSYISSRFNSVEKANVRKIERYE